VLRHFCAWLAHHGVDELASLSPKYAREYLASRGHVKPRTLSTYASILRCFFKYLGMMDLVPTTLSDGIEAPRCYRRTTPPPILDEKSVERLLCSFDRSTTTGKRNYAILLMAARYGLRSCDLRRLRLDDVHWRQRYIAIIQSKSQRPLELPLLEDVEAALVDYLRHGRPACKARELFVRRWAPIRALASYASIQKMMERAFNAAGISVPKGMRGVRLLRHSAATRMLRHGVSLDTISDVLGHASVETTRIYTQVDLDGLRSVALTPADVGNPVEATRIQAQVDLDGLRSAALSSVDVRP
jgi:site-specific recombinase XerD